MRNRYPIPSEPDGTLMVHRHPKPGMFQSWTQALTALFFVGTGAVAAIGVLVMLGILIVWGVQAR